MENLQVARHPKFLIFFCRDLKIKFVICVTCTNPKTISVNVSYQQQLQRKKSDKDPNFKNKFSVEAKKQKQYGRCGDITLRKAKST